MLTLLKLHVYRYLMAHPNIKDKLSVLFSSSYLYPGQVCRTLSPLSAGIIRKILSKQSFWKLTDFQKIPAGTLLRYIGPAKKLKGQTDLPMTNIIFEIVNPVIGSTLIGCDTLTLTKEDRKYIVPTNPL